MRRPFATIASIVIPALALVLGPPAPRAVATVYLLVAADTDDPKIGESVAVDAHNFPAVFRLNMPEHMITYAPQVMGADFRPDRILSALGGLPVVPGVDTVIFYYSGHGAYDPVRRQHYGQTPAGPLWHSQVEETLAALRPRLSVFLSDACSVLQKLPPVVGAPAPVPPTEVPPLLQSLFLDPTGAVYISATTPGETAIGRSDGGVFTNALCATFSERMQQRTTWSSVIVEVNARAKQLSPGQTAYAVRPLPGSPRLGLVAQETARGRAFGGLEITQVLPGMPATRVRARDGQVFTLQVNDVIVAINGRSIRNQDEYIAAVQGSPDSMTIRIVDRATNAADEYTADLGAGQARPRMRLGASAMRTEQNDKLGGVLVTAVYQDQPATRIRHATTGEVASITPLRDIILSVDGSPVRDDAEYRAAVAKAGAVVRLTIHDLVTGRTDDYLADLPD